jgi:hypothetical protein
MSGSAYEWFIKELFTPAPKQSWWKRNTDLFILIGTVLFLVGLGVLIGKFIL